jgi:hypothetical protein
MQGYSINTFELLKSIRDSCPWVLDLNKWRKRKLKVNILHQEWLVIQYTKSAFS